MMFSLLVVLLCSSLCDLSFGARYYGSKTLSSSKDMSIKMLIDESDDTVTFTFTGPTSKWFGVGFGSTKMKSTYAIYNVGNSGTVGLERTLGDGSSGSSLSSKTTEIDDYSSSGVRTVIIERAIDITTSSSYYDFSSIGDGSSLKLIWAYGSSSSFTSGHSSKGSTTITFYKCLEPSVSPTSMPTEYYNGTVDMDMNGTDVDMTPTQSPNLAPTVAPTDLYTCTTAKSGASMLIKSLFAAAITIVACILCL